MDAFEDLWKQAAPTSKPSASAASKLPLNAAANVLRQPTAVRDSFALLSAHSSAPASRALTPSLPSKSPAPSTTAASSANANVRSNGDAFSGLMSFGAASSSSGGSLSLADRQAKLEQERRERERKEKEELQTHGEFWDRFEDGSGANGDLLMPTRALGTGTSSRTPTPALEPLKPSSTARPSSRISSASRPAATDVWDLDSFTAPTATPPAAPAVPDPFDFDVLAAAPAPAPLPVVREPTPRSISPGDFYFGDREDHDDNAGDEDDILGALSRPVDTARRTPSPFIHESPAVQSSQPPSAPPVPRQKPRPSSPPPHIVGQIVEMGFSPQQARTALAATDTGVDVQAALESLLQAQSQDDASFSMPPELERELERERAAEEEAAAERRRRRRAGPSRQPPAPPAPDAAADALAAANIQEQADRLLAQASDFGMSMFSRAGALWKQGKEQVQKVYVEGTRAVGSPQEWEGGAGRARPKWMEDGLNEDPVSPDGRVDKKFSDGWERREEVNLDDEPSSRPAPRRPRPEQTSQSESRKPAPQADSLLSPEPAGYVSPARRRRPPQAQPSASLPPAPTPSAPLAQPVLPAPAAAPKPKPVRPSVPASSSALAASEAQKAKGTEFFKLGRFAEAETAYSAALDALPDAHSQRIVLWNNRAAARGKTGDQAGTVEDCTAVLSLAGEEENEWDGVPLVEARVKALSRRAEALEAGEKWEKAREDWERVVRMGAGAVGKKRWDGATRGAARCRKMLAPAVAPPPPKPRAPPKPQLAQETPSEAVVRLQQANTALDAETAQRASLKDSVDARLVAWKGGKEANLRALLASLDGVLWPELGWQRVGLGELVSNKQVKVRYMRAIAKVHPDKLNAGNTTVEQRMIANGVFGALNEAWNAFQQ